MNKKRADSLKTEAAMMVGMLKVPDGHMREFAQAMMEVGVFYGYYRGLGFDAKQAAIKAKKSIEGK